ncbi:hypothetical protein ACCY16_02025 [Candidatus Pantoea formicae]|uniref:hypothetical protein n=1 Tax=Candidatus Pantoea formicae TaxID=2608355 RepID=UPI003EDA0AC8
MITVTSCEYQENGDRRIYSFNDRSTVIECPKLPGKSRFRFYDNRNRTIYDRSSCAAMKKSVEQFKKMRGIKS